MNQQEFVKYLAGLPTGPDFGQNGDNVVFTRGGKNAQPMTVSAALLLQWIGQNIDLSTSVTYSEAQTLVNAGGLVPGQLYTITNATAANGGSGSVTVQAISTTQFAKQGAWIRPISQKAFGYVRIDTMAGADELSDITVNGVSVLANPVVFDTDIYTTVGLAVAEVTLGGYTAYRAGNTIVLVNDTAGATPNTHVVVSTGTGTYAATDGDIRGGASGTDYVLSVEYDFTTNDITWAFDPLTNLTISDSGSTSIYNFPWGERLGAANTAYFQDGSFLDCGISTFYFSGSNFTKFTYWGTNFSDTLFINVTGVQNHLTGSSYTGGAIFDTTLDQVYGTACSCETGMVIDSSFVNVLCMRLDMSEHSGGVTDTATVENSIVTDYHIPSGTGITIANRTIPSTQGYRTTTAATATTMADGTITVDATGGARTITLTTTSMPTGYVVNIKKIDVSANAVTLEPETGTIDGDPTLDLPAQYNSAIVQFDGTNFHVLSVNL